MSKEKWEIWWADVRFEDDLSESKIRPVLIMDNKETFLISFKITSKLHHEGYHIRYWKESGLTKESLIIVKKLSIIEEDFRDKIGILDQRDIIGLVNYMRENYVR